jgi:hypothetical protein
MKARTIQSLHRVLKGRKINALWSGHYPPPYTAEAFDNRGPVPFRSIGYAAAIIEINALIDAINELSARTNNQQ